MIEEQGNRIVAHRSPPIEPMVFRRVAMPADKPDDFGAFVVPED